MSDPPPIVDLASVLEPHLNGGKLVSYTRRYLTKPGENYGSIMLVVDAMVRQSQSSPGDNTGEELHLVAKLPPLTNDLYWEIFRPERTCISENAVYQFLAPEIRKLQIKAGLAEDNLFDGFPRYYGSRISLDRNATIVDRDAVLMQENLQYSGYRAGNRLQMYDYDHTVLVLEYMANFHALGIALRIQQPTVFDEYIRPYFRKFNLNANISVESMEELNAGNIKQVRIATNNNGNTVDRFKELLQGYEDFLAGPNKADGLFTSIVHFDLWINNILIKYDNKGKPCKLKMVDFQIAQYESILHDLVFFLFSSIETNLLEHQFSKLLNIYYQTFISCLQSVGVSTTEYSYALFWDEVKRVAPIEVPHAVFMTKVILADNSTLPDDFKDVDVSIMGKNLDVPAIKERTADILRLVEKFNFLD